MKFKLCSFLLLISLTSNLWGNNADTLAFEKRYKELGRMIDTINFRYENSIIIRDSLESLQDTLLVKFFLDTSSFNYSFKICSCIVRSGNMQVWALDQNTGGSFHSVDTYYRFKD